MFSLNFVFFLRGVFSWGGQILHNGLANGRSADSNVLYSVLYWRYCGLGGLCAVVNRDLNSLPHLISVRALIFKSKVLMTN